MTVKATDAGMVGQETISPLIVEPAGNLRMFDIIATAGAEEEAPVGQETISPLIVEPAPQGPIRFFDPIATVGAERAAPVGQETISPLIVEPAPIPPHPLTDPIEFTSAVPFLDKSTILAENIVTTDPLLTHNPPNIPASPDFIQSNPPGTPSGNPLPDFHFHREPVPVVQEFRFNIAQIVPPNNPMGAPIDLVTYPYTTGIALPLTEPANLRQPTSQETISPLIVEPPPPGPEPWPVAGFITQNMSGDNALPTNPTPPTPDMPQPIISPDPNGFITEEMTNGEFLPVNPTPPLDTGIPPFIGQKIVTL